MTEPGPGSRASANDENSEVARPTADCPSLAPERTDQARRSAEAKLRSLEAVSPGRILVEGFAFNDFWHGKTPFLRTVKLWRRVALRGERAFGLGALTAVNLTEEHPLHRIHDQHPGEHVRPHQPDDRPRKARHEDAEAAHQDRHDLRRDDGEQKAASSDRAA